MMKKIIYILLLSVQIAWAQTKHALVIAIADYPSETGWSSISSDKDLNVVLPVYAQQGFNKPVLLQDKKADKAGIIQAFKQLMQTVKPGDAVLIHYSGHGQQIADDNGDEPDGLDEAFVAYGAPSEYYEGYAGEKHLRDDEINDLLLDIRAKVGENGNVLMVVDACHSGTISRGVAKKRGGRAPIVPPGYNTKRSNDKGSGFYTPKTRGTQTVLAPLVLISASSFDEENSETFDEKGEGIGSLSYAIAKAMTKCGSEHSYRKLFADVLSIMNEKVPQQTPMVEGDIDYSLFGGNYIQQQKYYTVKSYSADKLVMNGGQLTGVKVGTKIGFYQAGTMSIKNAHVIATGIVVKNNAFESDIKLDVNVIGKSSVDLWGFIIEENLEMNAIKCNISRIKTKSIQQILQQKFAEGQIVITTGVADILITEEEGYLKLSRFSDGIIIDSVLITGQDPSVQIEKIIQQYAQFRYIRELKSSMSGMASIELIRCDVNGNIIEEKSKASQFAIRAGESMRVKVINRSNQKLYYNIIDIQPDGKMNAVAPKEDEQTIKHATQYVLDPKSDIILPYRIDIAPPYGNEVFKIFASTEPFNLVPYINVNTQVATRGSSKSISQAFKKSDISTRGASVNKTVAEPELYTGEVVFKITP